MKKLLLIFLLVQNVLIVKSQDQYPLTKYPMYSKIWDMSYDDWMTDEDGKPAIVFSPKDDRTFGDDCPELKNVNLQTVQSLLITELNNFRKDYQKNNISESKTLTSKSITDAKNLNSTKDYNIPNEDGVKIIFDRISAGFFSRVDFKNINLEKIIAESVFDWFVANDDGMSLLLSEQDTEYGVGIYVDQKNGVTIVIRCK